MSFNWLILIIFARIGHASFSINVVEKKRNLGVDLLSFALRDMVVTIPTKHVAFVVDQDSDENAVSILSRIFFEEGIMIAVFTIKRDRNNIYNDFAEDIRKRISQYNDAVYIVISNLEIAENIVQMIDEENFARRNVLYFFFIGKEAFSERFFSCLHETMRVCLIINPRYGIYQVLYNQAKPDKKVFMLVNWWSKKDGVFHSPLLPLSYQVYKDFNGRLFRIPVLHKPPWNFVEYNNESIVVEGGRDDKLLELLSKKLNFKYEYFDPPDRSQGSAVVNGTMQGVLGLIWRREVEIFIGDLTVTYERSLAVDFSFLTLTDSEAFLTHAPGRLNEALALIRPFNWKVWPAVIATFLMASPLLYLFFLASNHWNSHKDTLFCDCVWIITSIFLKQNISLIIQKDRVRLLVILLYLVSTYVIGDMYSANLTSMLAKPAREKPVSNLEQLNSAMQTRGFQLLVEKHSASHTLLENGTGLYRSIWKKMQSQERYLLNSTEEGMLLVRDSRRLALLGGRETFFYNTRRFGIDHFHLSEKIFTRYSAIALQIGCPFIHNFNELLMQLFEAGILTKITEDEYQKLGEKGKTPLNQDSSEENSEKKLQKDDDKELKAMSMKMLQGAFYVLLVGHALAGVTFFAEHIIKCCFLKCAGYGQFFSSK